MSGWLESTIGQLPLKIGDGNYSSKYPTAKEFISSGVPFISNKDIKYGRIIKTGLRYISHEKHSELKKGHLKKDDILVSTRANIGDIALVDKAFEDANINAQLVFLRCDEKVIHSKFLYHLLSSEQYHDIFQNHASGSAQMQLPLAALREIPIIYPEFEEQKAIASVLSSLDDKIDLLHRQNITLERMAETLFRQWFVEEAQEDWEDGTIEDLFILQRGYDLPIQNRTNGCYPIFAASGFSGGHVEYKVSAPGVTTGRSGILGKVFFVQENFWPLNTSLYIRGFKKGTPLFSYFVLKNIDLESFNAGSAVPTLNRNHVHDFSITIPPVDLIKNFESLMIPNFKKIDSNEKQIRTLEKLRDNLLPKLMSGELRINND